MSIVLVRSALEVALAAMSPALSTAWENADFDPVIGTPYQRVHLLPAPPVNPEMGGHLHTEQGIFKIVLSYPLEAGPAPASSRAELIRATFYRGRSFTASGVTVFVQNTPEISSGRAEADRWEVPVNIRFFAHIVRS